MAVKVKQHKVETQAGSNGHAPVRAALYARVSTEEQRERQSIQTQIEQARQHCQQEGVPLVAIYADEGVSGTIPFEERAEGRKLLEDARQKKFNLVFVYKVDRLGRADLVTHIARHHLETLGVGLRSLTEPFDTSTPHGRFMFGIFASFAQLERDNIRERSMAGTDRVMKSGKWSGGIVPYGYRRGASGYLEVNEDPLLGKMISEAELVRTIFRWAEERLSTLKIARRLNEMGIPPHYTKDGRQVLRGKRKVHTAGKWHAHRVGNMIHNTTYMGLHIYGKRSPDAHREQIRREVLPIVSPELWQQAQEALQQNLRWAKRNGKHNYLLSGLLKCGFCGRNLTGMPVRRPHHVEHYYRCNGQLTHVKDAFGPCQGRYLQQDWIEGLVWDELQDWILHHTNLEEIISEALQEQERERQEWRTTLSRIQAEIRLKEEERDRVVTAYRKGVLSSGDLERQLTESEKEKIHLTLAAADLEKRHGLQVDLETAIATIRQHLAHFRKALRKGTVPFSQRRQIVEAFVKEVRVHLKKGRKMPQGEMYPVLTETLPFRPGAPEALHTGERVTVWERPGNGSMSVLPEEAVRVLYRFPFPPKPKTLVSIADHMGRDSSRTPA